jgi:hypothetical protein
MRVVEIRFLGADSEGEEVLGGEGEEEEGEGEEEGRDGELGGDGQSESHSQQAPQSSLSVYYLLGAEERRRRGLFENWVSSHEILQNWSKLRNNFLMISGFSRRKHKERLEGD